MNRSDMGPILVPAHGTCRFGRQVVVSRRISWRANYVSFEVGIEGSPRKA